MNQEATFSQKLPSLCNPTFCDGHPPMVAAEKIEELLLLYVEESLTASIFGILMAIDSGLAFLLENLVEVISDPNTNLPENKLKLEKFRLELGTVTKQILHFHEADQLINFFTACLNGFGLLINFTPCLASLSASKLKTVLHSCTSTIVITNSLKTRERTGLFKLKINWTRSEIDTFLKIIAVQIDETIKLAVKSTIVSKWFDFLLKSLSATRLFQYGYLIRSYRKSPNGQGASHPAFFTNTITVLWQQTYMYLLTGQPFLAFYMFNGTEDIKKEADQYAAKKDYEGAIQFYDAVNFLAGAEPSIVLQSLTNCAALRLRICKDNPLQINAAIFDCCMALEIDPNDNVKALFRRGLGLALSKRWNQAIVDFERAVELDPNSPAKKELEVARR